MTYGGSCEESRIKTYSPLTEISITVDRQARPLEIRERRREHQGRWLPAGLQLGEREASVSSCFLKLQPVNKGISEAFPSQAELILKKVSIVLTCSRVQLPGPLLPVLL